MSMNEVTNLSKDKDEDLYDKNYTSKVVKRLKTLSIPDITHEIVKSLFTKEEVNELIELTMPYFNNKTTQQGLTNDNDTVKYNWFFQIVPKHPIIYYII